MGTRIRYSGEVKLKAIEMRLSGVQIRKVMETLQIRNKTQKRVWMKCYRNGELHRLEQPL